MDIDSSSRVPAARAVKNIDWDGWQPQDIATLTFVFDGSEVLLIEKKRGLGAGKVNAPGGRLEPGESITECAVREVREGRHRHRGSGSGGTMCASCRWIFASCQRVSSFSIYG